MMRKRWGRGLLAWGVGLLCLGALATPAGALTPLTSFVGNLTTSDNSFRLDADLVQIGTANCLVINQNGVTIYLNRHSIAGGGSGTGGAVDGIAISASTGVGKNVTVKGPGIIHDWGSCIVLSDFALVQDVLAYNCGGESGISLGNWSKCVQCRVHNVRNSEHTGVGIGLGDGCLLESSIVETSYYGARVGHDCKVWDLVLEGIRKTGLKVGQGTSVARSVISGCNNGPGLDYCDCGTPPSGSFGTYSACQDSSNSVSNCGAIIINNIADFTAPTEFGLACCAFPSGGIPCTAPAKAPRVVTDCATNVDAQLFLPADPPGQCGSEPDLGSNELIEEEAD